MGLLLGTDEMKDCQHSNDDILKVMTGGDIVWSQSVLFSESGTYIVPLGVTSIQVCLIGGGAGGNASRGVPAGTYVDAGLAGAVVSQQITVSQEEELSIIVGSGGANAKTSGVDNAYGGAGGETSITGYATAAGGTTSGHDGNGALGTPNCYTDSAHDGTIYDSSGRYAYGGQAGFANGSSGSEGTSQPGSLGSGGGAAVSWDGGRVVTSGMGGAGAVFIQIA